MAGNIQWFRWHHGSVTDPKFKLVAHKSRQTLSAVIAVWAYLLEQASASENRGEFGALDCEALDCLLSLDDGASAVILDVMAVRGLVSNGVVCAWEQRQPKRERVDESSTERSKAFRQKQRHATPEIDCETPSDDCETPRNATQRQETPRVEKSREEKKNTPLPPEGVESRFEQFWKAFPRKVGKDSAMKAFKKRNPDDALLSAMLAAIAVQAASSEWTKDGGQFIPHPATWLNAGRWQDEGVTASVGILKRDSDEYAAAHKLAGWWREAGFDTVWDAMAAKCWHDNAHQFRDGKRVQVTA